MLKRLKDAIAILQDVVAELEQPPPPPPIIPGNIIATLTPQQGGASIAAAYLMAMPGDTIVLRGGAYNLGTGQGIFLAGRSGAADAPVTIMAYPGEVVELDGSKLSGTYYGTKSAGGYGLILYGVNHIVVRGLGVSATWGGIGLVNSNDCIAIHCRAHHCGPGDEAKGFIVYGGSARNKLIECDAHDNANASGGNADGFQISSWRAGNQLIGCRAWGNSDDGFDLFNIHNGTVAGAVLLENCKAWGNGFSNGVKAGDGCGFKLGGQRANTGTQSGGHTIRRCMAWGNGLHGFDDNDAINGNVTENCTAYDNDKHKTTWAHGFYMPSGGGKHVIRNNVSFLGRLANVKGTITNNSWQKTPAIAASDFVSLDVGSPDFLKINSSSAFAGLGVA